jgi:serine phosphatase RsbU (regulator of sigma subunit)
MLCFVLQAQQSQIDSLEKKLSTNISISSQISILEKLITLHKKSPIKTLGYSKQLLALATVSKDSVMLIKANFYIGTYYYNKSDYIIALDYHHQAIEIAKKIKDKKMLADNISRLGSIYRRLKIYDLALKYKQESMQIYQVLQAEKEIGRTWFDYANIYYRKNKYDSALYCTFLSIPIVNKYKDSTYIGANWAVQAQIYAQKQDYEQALATLTKTIGYQTSINLIATNANNFADIYLQKKDYEKAQEYYEKGLLLAEKVAEKEEMRKAYEGLAKVFDYFKKYEQAYQYKIKASALQDSIFDEEGMQRASSIQFLYETKTQQAKIQMLAKDAQMQKEEKEKQEQINYLILLCLLGSVVFTSFIFQNRKKITKAYTKLALANTEIQQRKEEVETQAEKLQIIYKELQDKSNNITASINYARRIQNAILPFAERIATDLGADNFFIFFKPRDIVSGDFYFYEKVENHLIIAVADCTGHGVPGAFMSMIGTQILTEITIKNKEFSPEKILCVLHKEIRRILQQQQNLDSSDGMDMIILTISTQKNLLNIQYAGAMNPLYYVQYNQMHEIKADKKTIGGQQNNKEIERIFTKHHVALKLKDSNQPSIFYLTTDGFQDQFGGVNNRKFMTKKLKELLLEISEKPMATQKQILDTTLENWIAAANEKQTDDITIFGIKI